MAKLEEVFVIEASRKEADSWNKIHLFKMGDFWRAYEWSAWLIAVITYNENVRLTTKDRKPIHVTRMKRTDLHNTIAACRTISSYLGILSHTSSYNLRRKIFDTKEIEQIIEFDTDILKAKLRQRNG